MLTGPGLITGYHKSGSLLGTTIATVPIEIIRLERAYAMDGSS